MPGTLDLLILKALALRPMHGWGITSRIQEMSHDTFQIGQGSLYPALQRCERRGWGSSHWRGPRENFPLHFFRFFAPRKGRISDKYSALGRPPPPPGTSL